MYYDFGQGSSPKFKSKGESGQATMFGMKYGLNGSIRRLASSGILPRPRTHRAKLHK